MGLPKDGFECLICGKRFQHIGTHVSPDIVRLILTLVTWKPKWLITRNIRRR